jgi:hypothetical protein
MDMVNRLTRSGVDIKNGPVTFLVDIELLGQVPGDLKNVPDQQIVLCRNIIQRRNVLLWYNQKVCRSLGPYVLECHHKFILVYEFCRLLATNNVTEKT